MALSEQAATQAEDRIVDDLGEQIDLDTIVHVMKTPRRRWATEYAAARSGRINLRDLVDARSRIENEEADAPWNTVRNRVHASFHQHDTDTLVRAGVLIEVDEDDERPGYVFKRGPNAGAIAGVVRLLQWMCDVEDGGSE